MTSRWILGISAIAGLIAVFLFQRINVAAVLDPTLGSFPQFVINRVIRFLLNDLCSLVLIFALFPQRKYFVFSMYVQVIGVVLVLLPYFILKYHYPSYNGPLISFLHRLILNPVLLLLLIPAFYYQKFTVGKS